MRFLIEQNQTWQVEADDIEQANAIMQGTPPDTLDVHVQKLPEPEDGCDEQYDEGEKMKDPGFDIEWGAGIPGASLLRQQAVTSLMTDREAQILRGEE